MASTRIKWKDRTLANDIKYGGFLSYRHIRIIAWVCLILAQVGAVLGLDAKLDPAHAPLITNFQNVLVWFGNLPLPLFLLANFSTIMNSKGNYKALFIKYGIMAAGLFFLGNFVIFHYCFRLMKPFEPGLNWVDTARIFGELLINFGRKAFMLSVFIDLLLCLFIFYFLNYEPSKYFQGKKIILFRLMVLLPIAYEVTSILLKYKAYTVQGFYLPSYVFFLLPSKPPVMLLAFIVVAAMIKIGKVAYLKRGGHTLEDYKEHTETKAHSLKISIGIAIIFAVSFIIDLALAIFFSLFSSSIAIEMARAEYPDLTPEQMEAIIEAYTYVWTEIGFGSSTVLLVVAPLVLLFSYTKTHKNPKIDTLLPIAGVVLSLFVYLEGTFLVITLNMPQFLDQIRKYVDEEPPAEAVAKLKTFVLEPIVNQFLPRLHF